MQQENGFRSHWGGCKSFFPNLASTSIMRRRGFFYANRPRLTCPVCISQSTVTLRLVTTSWTFIYENSVLWEGVRLSSQDGTTLMPPNHRCSCSEKEATQFMTIPNRPSKDSHLRLPRKLDTIANNQSTLLLCEWF